MGQRKSLAHGGGEEASSDNKRSRCWNYIKQDYEKLQLTGKWKRKWMFFFFQQINKSLTKEWRLLSGGQ